MITYPQIEELMLKREKANLPMFNLYYDFRLKEIKKITETTILNKNSYKGIRFGYDFNKGVGEV